MDYLWRLAILLSAVLVLSCGQTERITEADDRYTHATTVGLSKYENIIKYNKVSFFLG